MKYKEQLAAERRQQMYEEHLEAIAESGILPDPNWELPTKEQAITGLVWAKRLQLERRLR